MGRIKDALIRDAETIISVFPDMCWDEAMMIATKYPVKQIKDKDNGKQ